MAEWDGASQWSNWRLNQEVVSTTVHSDCTTFSSSASDKGTTCLVLFPQLVGLQEGHPVCKKNCGGGTGVVICLERGADLHMAQLMPLPLTVSCFSEVQIGLPFWYWLTWVDLDKGPLNRCMCLCVYTYRVAQKWPLVLNRCRFTVAHRLSLYQIILQEISLVAVKTILSPSLRSTMKCVIKIGAICYTRLTASSPGQPG